MDSRRRGGGRGRFRATQDVAEDDNENEEDQETKNVDYGEFDAIKYSDECTDLYIRDSHRKHARMKKNFVEKKKQESSSDSDESFTEYPDNATNEWQHDR